MPPAPLEGFRVGITADRRSGELADLLHRRGATTLIGPTLATRILPDDSHLEALTRDLAVNPPDVVVANTGVGIRAWFEAAQAWGLVDGLRSACGQAHVVARGPKAVAALRVAGVETGAEAATERLDEVAALLRERGVSGARVVVQLHGSDDLPLVAELAHAGAEVIPLPVYRWELPADLRPARRLIESVADGDVDAVTFTSAPAVRNFFALADEQGLGANVRGVALSDMVIACVGPVCAEAAVAAGVPHPVAPNSGRLGLLIRVLTDALRRHSVRMSIGSREVVVQGRSVSIVGQEGSALLAPRELGVFRLLAARPGVVVGKPRILREVWGPDAGDLHVAEVTVTRLRRRIAPLGLSVVTVRGRGLRLQ